MPAPGGHLALRMDAFLAQRARKGDIAQPRCVLGGANGATPVPRPGGGELERGHGTVPCLHGTVTSAERLRSRATRGNWRPRPAADCPLGSGPVPGPERCCCCCCCCCCGGVLSVLLLLLLLLLCSARRAEPEDRIDLVHPGSRIPWIQGAMGTLDPGCQGTLGSRLKAG